MPASRPFFAGSPAVRLVAAFAALAGSISAARASEYRETNDFADAVAVAMEYADRFGAESTWLVVDIDNTLLAMQGDLGSDQWFEWQEYLQRHEPESPHLVAKTFPELLEVQGLLFMLGSMRAPQPNQPDLVRAVQDRGIASLVLTSRGPEFRPATERELAAVGYEFAKHAPAMSAVPDGEFLPYDPADPAAVGLTVEELAVFGLKAPKIASLQRGVFMTSGQHKGAMLLTAIHRAVQKPKAIVFVDDHGRHVHRVYDALTRRGVEATVLHYHREDDNVARFRYGDKEDVTQRWRVLKKALDQVFGLQPGPKGAAERSAALVSP